MVAIEGKVKRNKIQIRTKKGVKVYCLGKVKVDDKKDKNLSVVSQ
jgi:hypothetical protein